MSFQHVWSSAFHIASFAPDCGMSLCVNPLTGSSLFFQFCGSPGCTLLVFKAICFGNSSVWYRTQWSGCLVGGAKPLSSGKSSVFLRSLPILSRRASGGFFAKSVVSTIPTCFEAALLPFVVEGLLIWFSGLFRGIYFVCSCRYAVSVRRGELIFLHCHLERSLSFPF